MNEEGDPGSKLYCSSGVVSRRSIVCVGLPPAGDESVVLEEDLFRQCLHLFLFRRPPVVEVD